MAGDRQICLVQSLTIADSLKFGKAVLNKLGKINKLHKNQVEVCYEKRGQAIEYVTRKYGQERVSQIITFGTEAARAVIRSDDAR